MVTVQNENRSRARAERKISIFALRLLKEWSRLRLPAGEEEIIVAVSGGADSTALLLALDELTTHRKLASKITAAHLNHGLRDQQGELDALWVKNLVEASGHSVVLEHVNVRELAKCVGDNLEQAARGARYKFLLDVAGRCASMTVLTAHTMDDQAETVLLRLMRGSGVEGLGGMNPVRVLDRRKEVLLVRPLLRWARRVDTENYCRERDIAFRVDPMNTDERFARVRVRKQLLPLMQTFNFRIVDALSRTARLLQDDSSALQTQAEDVLREAAITEENGTLALSTKVLAVANASVRRRVLRQWVTKFHGDVRRLELVHLLAVEKLVFGVRGGRIAELPGGSFVERRQSRLIFHTKNDGTKLT